MLLSDVRLSLDLPITEEEGEYLGCLIDCIGVLVDKYSLMSLLESGVTEGLDVFEYAGLGEALNASKNTILIEVPNIIGYGESDAAVNSIITTTAKIITHFAEAYRMDEINLTIEDIILANDTLLRIRYSISRK